MTATRWVVGMLIAVACWNAAADVVRDGSIGPGTGIQPAGPDYQVVESMGQLVGSNLFHSFHRFGLTTGESVTFSAASAIDNVLGRVTGGEVSVINGLLRSEIPGASVFLLNPSGVILGPGASIEVDGSLHLSSADSVGFSGGESFGATAGGSVPGLVSATPEAFGFLGASEPIRLEGTRIELAPGERLTLVGGDVSLSDATIEANGGEVVIVATASTGEVGLGVEPQLDAFTRLGDVWIENDALIDVSADRSGTVTIQARDLLVSDSVLAATAEDTDSSGRGITLLIRDDVTLRGETEIAAGTEGRGGGGDVQVTARRLIVIEEAQILSDTEGAGNAGSVLLQADIVILDDDAEIASDVEAGASGRGGNVTLKAATIEVRGGAEISTDTDPNSTGEGGAVRLEASEQLRLQIDPGEEAGVFSNSEGTGSAGAITIETARLFMDGGVITARTEGPGRGGSIQIAATDLVIDNGAVISTESSGAGDAGNIDIDGGGAFFILDRASVSATSQLSDGGNIDIGAGSFELIVIRRGEVTANVNDGVGGNIQLAANTIVADAARIVAQAGAGRGGAIVISADHFFEADSLISASAGPAGISGTVEVNAPEIDLSSAVEALPSDYLDAAALLRARCAARRGGQAQGSLVVTGSRGLPSGDDGLPLVPGASQSPSAAAMGVIELSSRARALGAAGEATAAMALLRDARIGAQALSREDRNPYAWIHIALSHARLAEHEITGRATHLLAAHEILSQLLAEPDIDARARSYALGSLGTLYASEHRTEEALYLTRLALREATKADAPESVYRWHWREGLALWAQGRPNAAIRAYRRAVDVLEATRHEAQVRGGAQQGFFRRAVAPVYLDLVNALLTGAQRVSGHGNEQALLLEARDTVEQYRAAELRDYFHDECVAELESKILNVESVSDRAAIVYPIVFPERIELLVSLPGGIERFTTPVGAAQLSYHVRRLRRRLQDPHAQDFLGPSQRLYQWLIAPYAEALEARNIDTLVFVPDGPLRTIPMAALHDGNRFVVERYSVAVAPGLGLVDPQPLDREALDILLAGVSEAVQGFSPLPEVGREIEAIQARFGGTAFVDEHFLLERLRTELAESEPTVVHLATHAQFTGDASTSFVLTYDGRLSVEHLDHLISAGRFREQPLELLVLSACETAVGDERAALGLAGIAVRAGARSALGSLWKVSDQATTDLIIAFYDAIADPETTKAQALRSAQLGLLRDPASRHPALWSAFLLISNWL